MNIYCIVNIMCVDVRILISFLLPPWGFWGSNLSHETYGTALLSTEPSLWPSSIIFFISNEAKGWWQRTVNTHYLGSWGRRFSSSVLLGVAQWIVLWRKKKLKGLVYSLVEVYTWHAWETLVTHINPARIKIDLTVLEA